MFCSDISPLYANIYHSYIRLNVCSSLYINLHLNNCINTSKSMINNYLRSPCTSEKTFIKYIPTMKKRSYRIYVLINFVYKILQPHLSLISCLTTQKLAILKSITHITKQLIKAKVTSSLKKCNTFHIELIIHFTLKSIMVYIKHIQNINHPTFYFYSILLSFAIYYVFIRY
jgi:hypothetical protein